MKYKFFSKVLIWSTILALLCSAMGVAPAQAAGLYTHTVFVDRSIEILKNLDDLDLNHDYSELLKILETHEGIVNYGSVFPDVASKVNGDWGEIVHDTKFFQGNIDTLYFRNALVRQILPIFKNSPDDAEDEIAFLFGLIAHQEADGPWHFGEPNLEEEAAKKWQNELTIDWILFHYDNSNDVDFSYLSPNLLYLVRDATISMNSPSWFINPFQFTIAQGIVVAFWDTTKQDLGPSDDMKVWLEDYEYGGIKDGAGHTADAWIATWNAMNAYSPSTTAEVLPILPDGNNGWYRQSVNVTLDPMGTFLGTDTGPFSTWYSIDGGQLQEYVEPFTISTDGVHQISYYSVDSMVISEQPQTMIIKIDQTSPELNLWTDQVQYTRVDAFIVNFNGSDTVSGLASITGEFNSQPVVDGQEIDLFWLPLGTYTLTVNAEDIAGNVAEASQSVQLIVSLDGLKGTVARLCTEGYITKSGTCSELSTKLDAAIAAHNRGNVKSAANILSAFQNAIKAQMNKSIQEDAANLLLLDSAYVSEGLSR